jgi:hypothetical protein
MPPVNPWIHLLELIVPGIIGGAIAVFGVWLTNRRNATENSANREHAIRVERMKAEITAEAKSRDNRWAFRKDVYVDLIRSLFTFFSLRIEYLTKLKRLNQTDPSDLERCKVLVQQLEANFNQSALAFKEYSTHLSLAALATADSALRAQLLAQSAPSAKDNETMVRQEVESVSDLLEALAQAGRKDLWGMSEPQGKGG